MIDIEFEDYCVAYDIVEPVFASTLHNLPAQELQLAKAVKKLSRRRKRAVTVQEIAKKLNWKESMVYKHKDNAVKLRLIKYESGTHEKNVKWLLPVHHSTRFLPHPRMVMKRNLEIGRKVKYVDPFTGEWKVIRR